jgi:hypothetical protein
MKVTLHGIKALRGRRDIALLFLISRRSVGGGQRHAPAALTPVKETRYPLYRRPGVPPGLDGRAKSHPHLDSIPGPSSPYRVVKIAHTDATVAFCKGRFKYTQLH